MTDHGRHECETTTPPGDEAMSEKRLVIRYNTNANMSRGKRAAHAVHAALKLYGIEYDHPVIVLGGKPKEILDESICEVHVRDQGRTELEPGTLTAGASWEYRTEESL